MTHTTVTAKRRGAPAGAPTRSTGTPGAATGHQAPGPQRIAAPQLKQRVSQPSEPMELEANAVAARVVSGASPAAPASQGAAVEEVQRRESAGNAMSGSIPPRAASTIAHPGSGAPMPGSVRHSIERHLGTDLGGVRVHAGPEAARAATSLGARAFTVGNNIFLNRQESPLDTGLMAHESAHVVQQGAASANGPVAARATEEIQLLPDLITDTLADYARHVPGYTLLTYVIEYDPLRGEPVKPTAMALVEGLMGLVPFGTFVFDQLSELGVLQRAFEFIQGQLAMFDLSLERLERVISEAWEEMDFKRFDPFAYNLGVLERHLGRLVDDVTGFASSVISAVMDLIKEALIGVAEELLAENKAWALIKKILHYDPLRGEEVDASTVEILEDFLLLIGREQELEQMRIRGSLQQTADWLDTQVKTFLGLLSQLASLFSAAWEAIQPANLPDLPTTLPTLVQQAGAFLQQVWDFASTVASQVIELIKKALLGWLASFVDEVPGFHLLTVILGRNPFTGEAVPRSAVNLIRGFITLIPGGNEIYDRLAETGIIADAGARIEGAITELGISWEFIVGLFIGIWDTVLSIDTLIDPIGVFTLIRDQFGEPVSRLFAFIRVVLRTMFELLLALMNFPTDLIGRIIDNAMQAYEHIKRDPIGFLINMLAAVKLGFSHFFDNFLSHLVSGLVDWLFRGLRAAGIEPPEDLSFGSILQTVLQVLGISVERIWEKLAERFGQETIDKIRAGIDKVVGIWQLVQDISERGISVLWEYVESQLSNLWDTVLQAATDWIMEQVVNRVVTKLLSMLDPTGIMAVINGFVAFFNAIQSAIEYLRDILEIVDSYVATIASVAAGDIEPGAARLEGGLASAIPVAIGFLANQVGLGDIGPKIAEIVGRVREVVDKALDWLLDRLQAMVNRVLAMLGVGGGEPVTEDLSPDEVKERVANEIAPRMAQPFAGMDEAQDYLNTVLRRYLPAGLKSLVLRPKEAQDNQFDVVAAASAEKDVGNLEIIRTNVIAPQEGEIRGARLDSFGRATKAFGWLSNKPSDRDKSAQLDVSRDLNRLMGTWGIETRFDAGHLIAARYGGPGGPENLFPQVQGSNQSWWKTFESVVASEVKANGPGEFIYAEVRVKYGGDPFDRIATEGDLAGAAPSALISLQAALRQVPDYVYMERLGRRKADKTEEALNTAGPFDVRLEIQTLGRSLRGILGAPVRRGREVFQ